MGRLETTFCINLEQAGFEVLSSADIRGAKIPRACSRDLPSSFKNALSELQMAFGATNPQCLIRAGAWDIVCANGLRVEVDEEQHFNRYRAKTLELPWSSSLPWQKDYLRYSDIFEDACTKKASNRGYWSNNSTEKMFGHSAPLGHIEGPDGSSRWKQRAIYDALRDAYAINCPGVRLARVSIHDTIGEHTVLDLIRHGPELDCSELKKFISARTVG